MKTSNPAFSKDTYTIDIHAGAKMTFSGVMQKTGILLLLVVLSGSYVWNLFTQGANVMGWLWGGLIVGLILAFITIFNKNIAMYTAPMYAVAEGLVLGAISAMMQSVYPGIVFQAVLATFGVAALMLVLYQNRIIQVTGKFMRIMMFALGAVFITYLLGFILGFFGINLPIFGNGPIGILFSVIVAGVAAFMLLVDFAQIEEGVKHGAPKYMEWYSGFGLLVTLIWLYLEILRLLSKLRN